MSIQAEHAEKVLGKANRSSLKPREIVTCNDPKCYRETHRKFQKTHVISNEEVVSHINQILVD